MNRLLTGLFSTYSIVARDPATGQLGVAVQTHQMSVGRVVPWMLPGLGAVATQSLANISFGPMALTMLREGIPAERVIAALTASDDMAHRRQVAVVDSAGRAAAWTGTGCIAEAGHHVGEGYSVQANMMTNPTVVAAMSAAYESASGDLAARLMAAMDAAQVEGGDIRGMQSAALKIVPGDRAAHEWETVYDLRVDEHDNPLLELRRLVRLRNAHILSDSFEEALVKGDIPLALKLAEQVRLQAPELEEASFWMALTLADHSGDVATAAGILRPVLANDPRRDHWIDLIRRLQACGLLEREGIGEAIIAAL